MSALDYALAYAQRGWHVFPLRPDDKRPAIRDWENAATTDPQRIHAAWTGPYSRSGIGIACGPSRLVVVDLDTAKGDTPAEPWNLPGIVDGADVLAALYERHGDRFPAGTTPTARTASGGMHLYHQAPEQEVRNSASKVGWKVDVRAAGGYVVAPPSTAAGLPYTWETTPVSAPLPLPAWLLDLLLPKPRPVAPRVPPRGRPVDSLAGLVRFVLEAQQGERNSRLYWAACRALELVREGRADAHAVFGALVDAGTHIGLSQAEAEQTVRSADRAPERTAASA